MNRSPETAAISKALVAAQAEMKNPGFDTTNPHFRNRFASLASVRNAVLPVMAKHGISVTQEITTAEGGISCLTIFTHETGQFFEFGPLILPASKQDAQGFGSATTYAKRYSLQSAAGVVGDDDDDGNAASAKLAETQKGIGNHDPRGEGWKKSDTKAVKEIQGRIMKAIESSNDEAVIEAWNEACEDHDFGIAVWAVLPKPIQNKIKDLKEQM
jgi:hypothetical protein